MDTLNTYLRDNGVQIEILTRGGLALKRNLLRWQRAELEASTECDRVAHRPWEGGRGTRSPTHPYHHAASS